MADPGHIYVSRQLTLEPMRALGDIGRQVVVHDKDEPPSRSRLLADVAGAAAAITLLTDRVDAEFFDAAGDQLRIVANCAVGYDNIDIPEARKRGIFVTNTPGVLDEATADLALGLILATTRRIVEADRFVRSGASWIWGPRLFVGLDVSAGTVLGIVGLGRIGMAVARRAHAFGMRILATGRRATSDEAVGYGVEACDLDTLLAQSDVVTLHCPLNDETRHLIAAAEMAAMKPSSVLINTARGPIVDENALVEALRAGIIRAAGLDVFEDEPEVHPGLLELPNVVLLPHIGSAGDATRDAMGNLAVDNVMAVLRGAPPPTPIPIPPAR